MSENALPSREWAVGRLCAGATRWRLSDLTNDPRSSSPTIVSVSLRTISDKRALARSAIILCAACYLVSFGLDMMSDPVNTVVGSVSDFRCRRRAVILWTFTKSCGVLVNAGTCWWISGPWRT
eukprot:COSAG02_NODE_37051_length_447_cov_0.724138_1_plen_122_part_01